jgi:hypothetical protein
MNQRDDREPAQVPVGAPDGAAAAAKTGGRHGAIAAERSGTDAAATTGDGSDHDTRFFGQPWALAHIFGVEMWERFSFYGMQVVMTYYLYFSVSEGGLGLPQSTALGIIGAYGGTVYLCTILGAWLADRLLGSERVLFFSAIVIMAGHVALAAIPGFGGVAVGLILVALALLPGHRARHGRTAGRVELVVDDGLLADAAAHAVAERCALAPSQVSVTVTARRARVRIRPISGVPVDERAAAAAAERALDRLGYPLQPVVIVSSKGVLA